MDVTFGARLRQQREQQQIALAAIAEETKINVALLEGLERDDVSRWPGGLFRRAYIRAYAHRIGLDPEQVLREFMERYPDPVQAISPIDAIAENAGVTRGPRTRLGLLLSDLASRRFPRRDTVPLSTPLSTPAPTGDDKPHDAFTLSPEDDALPLPGVEQTRVEASQPPRPMRVPTIESAQAQRDSRAAERLALMAARLCTRIACAADERDLTAGLADTAALLEADGAIVWLWDDERAGLCPVLAHGYPDEVLLRLPLVRRSSDNAIALAFRASQKRIVRSDPDATGALVLPMLSPDGCVGVLALEFADGAEQQELIQALATIVAAQLSTLCTATQRAAEGEWPQTSKSLAAS